MTTKSKAEKWDEIYTTDKNDRVQAAQVLQENLHLLPATGKAFDLACGKGGNAMLLAEQGLETHAWDISKTAIDNLQKISLTRNISLELETRDLSLSPPVPKSFDIIVVTRFLDRGLIPFLLDALRDGGLIYYQTFIREKTATTGPRNPDYRLAKNELLNLFRSLKLVFYREEGRLGNLELGFRNEAMLIAQKSKIND